MFAVKSKKANKSNPQPTHIIVQLNSLLWEIIDSLHTIWTSLTFISCQKEYFLQKYSLFFLLKQRKIQLGKNKWTFLVLHAEFLKYLWKNWVSWTLIFLVKNLVWILGLSYSIFYTPHYTHFVFSFSSILSCSFFDSSSEWIFPLSILLKQIGGNFNFEELTWNVLNR